MYSINKVLGSMKAALNCRNSTVKQKFSKLYLKKKKIIIDIEDVPVAWMHKHTVKGHDLLLASGVVKDPPCCGGRSGDDTVHVTPDVPGDNPRSIIVLQKRQVANLHSKVIG